MLVPVYNVNGEQVGERDLPESIFGVEPNEPLMHQALTRQLANARLGTHSTKTRGDVSGGGRKPWRQKGTGRARQGSTRAPHWRGGGVAFGPHPRGYTQDMPKKMRRAALRSALSVKAQSGMVVLIDSLSLAAPRTRDMRDVLTKVQAGENAIVALSDHNGNIELASRNLPKVKVLLAGYLNVRDLLQYDRLVLPVDALDAVEAWLTPEGAAETEAAE